MGVFATRGCKEDFVPNPELLNEGKVISSTLQLCSRGFCKVHFS